MNENEIKLFPNPASGNLNIISGSNIEYIEFINLLGSTVLKQSVNTTEISMDISKLEAGIYFVRLFANDQIIVQKFQVAD